MRGRTHRVTWTVCAAVACSLFLSSQAGPAFAAQAPNIVVVMSDDQPYFSVDEMPFVSSLEGLEPFGTLYDNVSLCCPARAAFLTGLYAHHNQVEINSHGDRMDPRRTLAKWLDDGGYETGLFGKYLNGYPFERKDGEVPPGWDRWVAFASKPSYYRYDLTVDGERRSFGSGASDYSTDVLAGKADKFVQEAPQPFFALVTPFGPHGSPGREGPAAPRHEGLYDGAPFARRPNFGQAADGAPYFYRQFPTPSFEREAEAWRERMESLRSVDELTETVVTSADQRSRDTVVVYLSDNGFSLGSHRWPEKRCGYEECGRVPGLIRAPGDPSGLLASIADLAPTLADMAGVPRPPTDGRSLIPYFNGRPEEPDRAVLLQNRDAGRGVFGQYLPGFWGLRTPRWKYLDHNLNAARPGATKLPEELYDLRADPFELENLAQDRAYKDLLREMRAQLLRIRNSPPQG